MTQMYDQYENYPPTMWEYSNEEDEYLEEEDEYLFEDEYWVPQGFFADDELIDGEYIDYIPGYVPSSLEENFLGLPFHPLTLIAALLIVFMVWKVFIDTTGLGGPKGNVASAARESVSLGGSAGIELSDRAADQLPSLEEALMVIPPYESYVLTQGPHGYSYGHTAIDITAGQGAEIHSPIYGTVSESFVDGIGNTVLVIENQVYRVMLLHGIYQVSVGDVVEIGQVVGTESNQGNTFDAAGRSCRGRDCGYHTHLNIFDKLLGVNVNPLELIE